MSQRLLKVSKFWFRTSSSTLRPKASNNEQEKDKHSRKSIPNARVQIAWLSFLWQVIIVSIVIIDTSTRVLDREQARVQKTSRLPIEIDAVNANLASICLCRKRKKTNLSSESMNPINIKSDIRHIWSEACFFLFDLMTRDHRKDRNVKKKNSKREMEIYLRLDDLALDAIHLSHWAIFVCESHSCLLHRHRRRN